MSFNESTVVKLILSQRVRLTACAWAVVRDTHIADDIFQETVIKAIKDPGVSTTRNMSNAGPRQPRGIWRLMPPGTVSVRPSSCRNWHSKNSMTSGSHRRRRLSQRLSTLCITVSPDCRNDPARSFVCATKRGFPERRWPGCSDAAAAAFTRRSPEFINS